MQRTAAGLPILPCGGERTGQGPVAHSRVFAFNSLGFGCNSSIGS